MNPTLTALILAASTAFALAAEPAPVTHVDADAAHKLVEEGKVVVLDVRTPEEFAEGHIKGAKNIDFTADDFEQKVAALDPKKSYLVHCASGGRSTKSLPAFEKKGFTSIYHLDGGFNGWQDAGKPVAK